MIELIYNEEEDVTLEERALPEPKNIKQVGEPREYKKIFIEDFVHTFLQQYSAEKEQRIRLAVLLGNSERCGGKRHLYVKSAFPVEGVTEKQGKYNFTEKVWGTVYLECEKYFPGQEIVGWFLARPGFAVEKNAVMEETHRTYFSGADKVLFVMEPLEGDSAFFGFDGNRFAKQSGYYIYYEKNEPMREFIMEKNREQKQSAGNEQPDVVMANFRKILKEKQEQNEKRKKRAVSYGMKVAVALVLFVGAVTLKNQTDKIAAAIALLPGEEEPEFDGIASWYPDVKKWACPSRLGVALNQQGKGIAGQMLAAAMDAARGVGCEAVRFLVAQSNPIAQKAYRRLEFDICGEHEMWGHRWLCYQKRL